MIELALHSNVTAAVAAAVAFLNPISRAAPSAAKVLKWTSSAEHRQQLRMK